MMSIRMLVRAPVMLVSATVMATSVSGETGVVFIFAIPALAISMGVISIMAFPRFQAMLKSTTG